MMPKILKSPIVLLTLGGFLLLIFSAWLWWVKVYQSPYNVFWGMLSNSLSTSSVTKHINQQTNGTQLDQYFTLNYGLNNHAFVLTNLKDSSSNIKTESIGTLTANYQRYDSVDTTQKNKNGKKLDFSSVLGKWSKTPVANNGEQSSTTSLFTQAALGLEGGNVIPVANLSARDRTQLIEQLRQSTIFDVSYKDAKKQTKDGRRLYTYDVTVEPVAYVAFEKAFAQKLGIKALDNIDPNSYQGGTPIKVAVAVDAHSHELYSVTYSGTSHTETYSSSGISQNTTIPKTTISAQKLQSLFSQVK